MLVRRRVASDFRFCPPSPPIYFLPYPTVIFWKEKVAVFSRKNRLNLWFRPEKAFGFRRKPFFLRSPDFHWNFALIQIRKNESLGQVQRWFSALPPRSHEAGDAPARTLCVDGTNPPPYLHSVSSRLSSISCNPGSKFEFSPAKKIDWIMKFFTKPEMMEKLFFNVC